MDELDDKLLVDIARLDPEGETLEGEVDIVDYTHEFIQPFGGVRYRLHVQPFGRELLVRGHLEQDFTLACSRCGQDFDTTVKVDDFTMSVEMGEKDEWVDLTNDARECIILALPSYPLCDEACPGLEHKVEEPLDSRWGALENFKVES